MAGGSNLDQQRGEQHVILTQWPPHTWSGILRRLGPGLIIAGSIVGSGELIGTTKVGAEAGFWLLWLIIVGCIIKVFVQIEFGRFAITEGRTTMEGMNLVPGPRMRVNWLVWYWVFMFMLGLGQLGGIVGGVGQSLAMTVPIQGDLAELVELQMRQHQFDQALKRRYGEEGLAVPDPHDPTTETPAHRQIQSDVATRIGPRPVIPDRLNYTYDDIYWAALCTVITSLLLVNGRYGMIQSMATAMVALFTALTIVNLIVLQSHAHYAASWSDIADGLSFRLPPKRPGISPVATALATFGIIGVGASELVAYPYWCLEKGYARFTGLRDASAAWAERARGWLRVMQWDAWLSMVVYTFATVAFFMLGAGVLHRQGLNPSGNQMIRTLAEMYRPVFGAWGGPVFLFGAVAVLYSTFFVATAGNTRMAADALRVFKIAGPTEEARRWWIRLFCGVFPFLSLTIFTISKDPVRLVLISGMAQSIMLPMLGGAALYFRYRRCDPRIRPRLLWDIFLWASVAGLLVTGSVGAYSTVGDLAAFFSRP